MDFLMQSGGGGDLDLTEILASLESLNLLVADLVLWVGGLYELSFYLFLVLSLCSGLLVGLVCFRRFII